MRTPEGLEPLLEDGIIDEVIGQLKSGKEAAVFLVRCGDDIRCAKVYKDMGQRSFQRRARYQEGRKVRGSREARARARSTRFGRKDQEEAWKNTEVDALHRLRAAGVRVPEPFGFFSGVLLMELIVDGDGHSAPRLGEVDLSADEAHAHHRFLIGEIARMLHAGMIHGDLSAFNVLVGRDGPVIIDLPQAVNAAGNNNAFEMLDRDVRNINRALATFAPELEDGDFASEMWALFEAGELRPDSPLTGAFAKDETAADVGEVMFAIDEAREEALRRQRGREEAAAEGS